MQLEHFLPILLVLTISYLLGSVPTAYLVARVKNRNIFEVGSGNMGSTNVARAMGMGWGLLVWFFDSVKGILAILIATRVMGDNLPLASVLGAVGAIVGHNWSLFAALITGTLRGGKGAATAFGTMLLIAPLHVFAAMCMIGALLIAVTRYVSLGVLAMFGIAILWLLVLVGQRALAPEYAIYSVALAAMILVRFKGNIQRLLAGTERRLGERA